MLFVLAVLAALILFLPFLFRLFGSIFTTTIPNLCRDIIYGALTIVFDVFDGLGILVTGVMARFSGAAPVVVTGLYAFSQRVYFIFAKEQPVRLGHLNQLPSPPQLNWVGTGTNPAPFRNADILQAAGLAASAMEVVVALAPHPTDDSAEISLLAGVQLSPGNIQLLIQQDESINKLYGKYMSLQTQATKTLQKLNNEMAIFVHSFHESPAATALPLPPSPPRFGKNLAIVFGDVDGLDIPLRLQCISPPLAPLSPWTAGQPIACKA